METLTMEEKQRRYEETKARFQARNKAEADKLAKERETFAKERKLVKIMPAWLTTSMESFNMDNPFFEFMIENGITFMDLYAYIGKYTVYEHDQVYKFLPDGKHKGYKKDMLKRLDTLYNRKGEQLFFCTINKAFHNIKDLEKQLSFMEVRRLRSKTKEWIKTHEDFLNNVTDKQEFIDTSLATGIEEVNKYFDK